jgi:glyoxylase-like metal-dependent hydrolase (beta-lactamase superfamily II)
MQWARRPLTRRSSPPCPKLGANWNATGGDFPMACIAFWPIGWDECCAAGLDVMPGPFEIGGRALEAIALSGHSGGDLAVMDKASGTLITGDLVFHNRAPATPDADLEAWRQSLDRLDAMSFARLIPGHGPVNVTHGAIAQTRDWLNWLDGALSDAVARGLDMGEAGDMPIPDRFASVALARYELQRSVSHFYAGLEAKELPRIDN